MEDPQERVGRLRPPVAAALACWLLSVALIVWPAVGLPEGLAAPVRPGTSAAGSDEEHHDGSLDSDLVCLAKVVHREARHEVRDGRLAVAQVVLNRMQQPRDFAATACAVAAQAGQFFDVHAYQVDPADPQWVLALEAARAARTETIDRSRGALYFRPIGGRPSPFFRRLTLTRVLGRHAFYR